MPRGRGRGGHKGQRRHFSNPDHLEEVKEKQEREKQWRQQRGELSSEEEEEEGGGGEKEEESSKSSSEEENETEEASKAKGVQHLIEIENPNRVVKKEKKIVELEPEAEAGPQLSRREREEIERQKAKAHYLKMHAAGKTAEARSDLARLAIIKQQREEAARKRELEVQAKQKADSQKLEQTKRALGKKT